MIYLLNLIFSTGYCYYIREKEFSFKLFLPIFLLWSIIIGFQYDVGTDYFSYLNIYNNPNSLNSYFYRKEYIFHYTVAFLKFFFKNGQSLFVFTALVENALFYMILKNMFANKIIKKENLYVYVFLFLSFGTVFYNQMNGLRQYFNIYLLYFLVVAGYFKQIFRFLLSYAVGLNIHRSFIFLLPVCLCRYIVEKIGKKTIFVILCIAVLIAVLPVTEYVRKVILWIPRYSHYANGSYFDSISMKGKITKLIYLPFYFESLKLISNFEGIKNFMLKVGLLSYAVKVAGLVSSVSNRFGEYFTLLAIFPIYYIVVEYWKKKEYWKLGLLLAIIMGFYILKVLVLARAEYAYQFYFWR